MKALDERAKKIADGLAAADKGEAPISRMPRKGRRRTARSAESATDVGRALLKSSAAVFDR